VVVGGESPTLTESRLRTAVSMIGKIGAVEGGNFFRRKRLEAQN